MLAVLHAADERVEHLCGPEGVRGDVRPVFSGCLAAVYGGGELLLAVPAAAVVLVAAAGRAAGMQQHERVPVAELLHAADGCLPLADERELVQQPGRPMRVGLRGVVLPHDGLSMLSRVRRHDVRQDH